MNFINQQKPEAMAAIANTPEGKKLYEAGFGKEHAPMAMQLIQAQVKAKQQEMQSFPGASNAGASTPAPSGPGGQPPPPPSGAAPSPSGHTIDPSHGDPNTPEALSSHMAAVTEWGRSHPDAADAVKQELETTKARMEDARKGQEFQYGHAQQLAEYNQTNTRIDQQNQALNALRQQGQASSNEFKAASLALRQSENEANQQMKGIMLGLKQSQDKAQQQTQASAGLANLNTRANALLSKPTKEAALQLPSFNADVKLLKKRLEDSGMPEIAATLKPLKLGTEPGMIYGTNPAIVEDDSGNAGSAAAGGTTTLSKSGRKMVKDPKAPHGYSYAD